MAGPAIVARLRSSGLTIAMAVAVPSGTLACGEPVIQFGSPSIGREAPPGERLRREQITRFDFAVLLMIS
jgi:hypothetical protein